MSADRLIERRYGLDEAVQVAAKMPRGGASQASSRKDSDWSGATFDDALRMARNGAPIEAANLRKVGAAARIRTAPQPTPVLGVTGNQVDMGRYMQGLPECMLEDDDDEAPTPVLRIAVERAVTYGVDTRDIRAVGASVLAAISALRLAGVPCEIWATFSFGDLLGAGRTFRLAVCVQRPGQPIDAHRLAYWVAHQSTLRRMGFALLEHEPEDIRNAWGFGRGTRPGGYGLPRSAEKGYAGFDEVAPATAAEAQGWLRDVLARRAGIEVLP